MRIGILTSRMSRSAGGLYDAVRLLANAVSTKTAVAVFGLKDQYWDQDGAGWQQVSHSAFRVIGPTSFGFSAELKSKLEKANLDLLCCHGLWTFPGVACSIWSQKYRRPYIVHPHGMLNRTAIRISGLKKRVAWHIYQRQQLDRAACIRALSAAEAVQIRRLVPRVPICTVPNGVELPDEGNIMRLGRAERPASWARSIADNERVLLFLGRLHPIKGLQELIAAWARALASRAEFKRRWRLVIAGWGDPIFERSLRDDVRMLEVEETVIFVGAQFGADRTYSYQSADGFVLTSRSEALPTTALEAWAFGLPALLSIECGLSSEAHSGAGILTAQTCIADSLIRFMSMSDSDRTAMGSMGREIVRSRFNWNRAAGKMLEVYRWLLFNDSRPDHVIPGD